MTTVFFLGELRRLLGARYECKPESRLMGCPLDSTNSFTKFPAFALLEGIMLPDVTERVQPV